MLYFFSPVFYSLILIALALYKIPKADKSNLTYSDIEKAALEIENIRIAHHYSPYQYFYS